MRRNLHVPAVRDGRAIAAKDREQKVAFLSGGNQQKVVISKCLNRDGDILLMDEPTRGVDVGAKQEIHDIIRTLANTGKGVIVFSSDFPHFEGYSDPMGVYEKQLAELSPERLERFYGGSMADVYARMGDPLG